MNIMIASDIHGSAYYCGKLLEAFKYEQSNRLFLLGDILYHGPRNDLPKGYDPKVVAKMLNGVKEKLLCVRGNCDSEVDQMVLEFPIMAEYCILCIGKRMIFATHGHHFNVGNTPALQRDDILLNGHTHVSGHTDTGSYIYANPGSVSIPKENTLRGYIILNDEGLSWKSLDREIYDSFRF